MQTTVLYLGYVVLILLFSTAYNTSLIYCFVIWCLHTNKRRPCSSTLSGHPSSSISPLYIYPTISQLNTISAHIGAKHVPTSLVVAMHAPQRALQRARKAGPPKTWLGVDDSLPLGRAGAEAVGLSDRVHPKWWPLNKREKDDEPVSISRSIKLSVKHICFQLKRDE